MESVTSEPSPAARERARLERLEIDYWRTSSATSPAPDSVESLTNTLNKLGDSGTFLVSLLPFLDIFRRAASIVEIGADRAGRDAS